MIDIEIALQIALKAHWSQTDLDGKPAILHPLRVGLAGESMAEIVVGFLHDVVEDSGINFSDLESYGTPKDFIDVLELLTKQKNENYDNYLDRIIASKNQIALRVKFNDLSDNLQRNNRKTENKKRIYNKHRNALLKIKKALNAN